MTTLLPYLYRFDPERQVVFERLRRFSRQFVLAGGTAMMLQIGHRLSFDFDCFSEKLLPSLLPHKAKTVFGPLISPEVQTREQLTFKTAKGINVTFVYHPYKPLKKIIETSSISLFHLDDLAANKAYTIGRRAAWRDYVDLFFLLKWKLYTMEKIITLGKQKFSGEFGEKLFLQQLVYFKDIEVVPTIFLKEKYTPHDIETFLSEKVEAYLKKVLEKKS